MNALQLDYSWGTLRSVEPHGQKMFGPRSDDTTALHRWQKSRDFHRYASFDEYSLGKTFLEQEYSHREEYVCMAVVLK